MRGFTWAHFRHTCVCSNIHLQAFLPTHTSMHPNSCMGTHLPQNVPEKSGLMHTHTPTHAQTQMLSLLITLCLQAFKGRIRNVWGYLSYNTRCGLQMRDRERQWEETKLRERVVETLIPAVIKNEVDFTTLLTLSFFLSVSWRNNFQNCHHSKN